MPLPSRAAVLPLLALAALLLACTLSAGGGDDSGTPDSGVGGGPSESGDAIAPTVRVLDPASGAQVPRGQPVDLVVATDRATDRFQVNVNGAVAMTKALPPDQTGPAQAILNWTPTRDGTYTVEVIAFNGGAVSAPASLILTVAGTAATTDQGVAGCVGRVMVSELNFREGAGTATAKLGQFAVGETVTVIGRNNDTSWYRVQRPNAQQVWTINNPQWVQVEGQCGDLPVVG